MVRNGREQRPPQGQHGGVAAPARVGDVTMNLPRSVQRLRLRGDLIAWLHLYMEPVEQSGAGIDAAVSGIVGGGESHERAA